MKELEFQSNRMPFEPDSNPDDDAPRINWVQLALRYRWQLVLAGLLGLLLGQLAYWRLGPEYEAMGQVMVRRKTQVPLKDERNALLDWGDRSEHIPIIKSSPIANKAIVLGELNKYPTFQDGADADIELIDGLRVKRTAGQDRSHTNILDIAFTSKRPEEAVTVVTAIIRAYGEYLDENRAENSSDLVSKTQRAYDDLSNKLSDKQNEYNEFRRNSPLQWKVPVGASSADGLGGTTNVHQEAVLALEEQRRVGLIKRKELESRIQAIQRSLANHESREGLEMLIRRFLAADGASGGAEVQSRQQELASFENRLLPLLLEEQRLQRDYGADHPELRTVRQSIELTLTFYRNQGLRLPGDTMPTQNGEVYRAPVTTDFVQVYVESVRQQIAELQFRDKTLLAAADEESSKAKEFAVYQTRDEQLNAELQTYREQLNKLQTKLTEVEIDRDNSGYSMSQLGPVRHTWVLKRLLKFWAGGIMLSTALLTGIIVMKELQDTTLKSVEDVKMMTQQPLLGSVTQFSTTASEATSGVHPALRYLIAPTSPAAENYRNIRTALLVAAENRHARVLQVSSPEPGDGKTTLISNLAIALARSGKRILLIDSDLRRPSVHILFGLRQEAGLSDVLSGELDIATAIHQTRVDGLHILTAGTSPDDPAEVLSSLKVPALLRDVSRDYDFVLIDCPPLLAVSDPCVIARHTDGMLLVVRLGKNRRASIRQVRDLLYGQQINVLGVVANALVSTRESGYQYDAYYNYQKSRPVEVAEQEPAAV